MLIVRVALLLFPAAVQPQTLSIGVAGAPERPDFSRGATFGALEAAHTARLIAGTCPRQHRTSCWSDVRVVDLAASPRAGVHAIVAAAPLRFDGAPDVVTLALSESTDIPGALFLAPDSVSRLPAPVSAQRVVAWHHSLERYGAAQLSERYRAWSGTEMNSDAWLGWFAVKLVWEAASRVGDPFLFRGWIADSTRRFDGHKGARLRFEMDRLVQPLYVLERGADGGWTVTREIR